MSVDIANTEGGDGDTNLQCTESSYRTFHFAMLYNINNVMNLEVRWTGQWSTYELYLNNNEDQLPLRGRRAWISTWNLSRCDWWGAELQGVVGRKMRVWSSYIIYLKTKMRSEIKSDKWDFKVINEISKWDLSQKWDPKW